MAKRILVVDDSALSRKRFLAKPLSEAGFEVIEAPDGDAGLVAWDESQTNAGSKFDCIITDLLMPVMDGFEFIQLLRERGFDVPIIVATADIQDSSRQKIEEAGAAGFLGKPYTPDVLLDTVGQALGQIA